TNCGDWKMAMLLFSVASLLIAVFYYIVVLDFNPKQPEASSPNNQLKTLDVLKEFIKNKNNWLLTFFVGLSFTAVDAFAGF
ncbi:MFS transporter, partial [Francisella tularensis subsp. holarctica]|nr:MFS transporter [Francisella tularensis subsp. holarctica]